LERCKKEHWNEEEKKWKKGGCMTKASTKQLAELKKSRS
jgi:hypothetical protein